MRRGDVAVLSISAALAAVVVAAVVVSFYVDQPREVAENDGADSTSSLLVLTWGPSLCTVDRSNPGCRSGHVGQMGPALILHGLWPQPSSQQFCELPRGKRDLSLAAMDLPQDVRTDLGSMMSDASILAPHEWKAHGTCSGLAPGEYFGIATDLAGQASQVLDPLFRNTRGGSVSVDELRDRMDATFGAGAGRRVSLSCRKADGVGMVAYEVQMSLPRVVDLKARSLADAIAEGPPVPAGCRRGSVAG